MTNPATIAASQEPTAKELQGQVILVTGGSRGIGRAIVETLAARGAIVGFTYAHQRDQAEALAGRLHDDGCQAQVFHTDVRDFSRAQAVIEELRTRFDRFDGLVNNAGITRDKALMLMKPSDCQDVIDTNLTGAFNYCRAAIVTLLKQRSGRIVNVTSVSGVVGMARQVNYAASKAGLIGLTKALAKEVAAYGVLVNAVAPGFIETDMTRLLDEKRRATACAQIPLGRFGTAEEIARVIGLLFGPAGAYLTGQVITVDGGLAI